MRLDSFNTRIDDEFDKKYGRVRSKGSSKIQAKLQFLSKIKTKLNRRRMRNYSEIYEDAKDNVEAALKIEKKLQTTPLNDIQKGVLKSQRDDYVDAVAENSEEAAKLVDKMLKTSGEYSRNRVYKFVSRHPHVFKLDSKGNKRIKLQKNVFLRILTKMIPRYRKYESAKREEVKNQVMDRFDNLLAVEGDKLLGSREGLDALSRKDVVRTVAATLVNDRDAIPGPSPVEFEGASTPVAPGQPVANKPQSPADFINSWRTTAPATPVAPEQPVANEPQSPTDFINLLGDDASRKNKPTVESLLLKVEDLERQLQAEREKNKQLLVQIQSGVVATPIVTPAPVANAEFESLLSPQSSVVSSFNASSASTPDYGSGHAVKL